MKKIVVCRFDAYRDSENPEMPYPVKLCTKYIALSKDHFESDRRSVADRLLKEYSADEVSCAEHITAELYEGV